MADSGSGKTGALASLANAGYNVRVLDFDNGLDVLRAYLTPEGLSRVHYVTLTDKLKGGGASGSLPEGIPQSTATAMKMLDNWKIFKAQTKDEIAAKAPKEVLEDFGPVSTWDENDVIVIDSLTLQGNSALRHIMAMNNASHEKKWGWYGPAMEVQEGLLERLYSTAIHCNVIVTCHITYQAAEDEEMEKGYPSALGKKLPPKVSRYFNSVLGIKVIGSGRTQKRVLRTVSEPRIAYKNPAPQIVPPEVPLEVDAAGKAYGGLARYFELVKSVANEESK